MQESKDPYTLPIPANTDDQPHGAKDVKELKRTLGEKANINVEYVENIPVMNSLKRKLIVSKLKN
jgi:hypothetical protein